MSIWIGGLGFEPDAVVGNLVTSTILLILSQVVKDMSFMSNLKDIKYQWFIKPQFNRDHSPSDFSIIFPRSNLSASSGLTTLSLSIPKMSK